jgi:hypothetical protein
MTLREEIETLKTHLKLGLQKVEEMAAKMDGDDKPKKGKVDHEAVRMAALKYKARIMSKK